MPFDFADRKRNREDDERRIDVCRSGDIRTEPKHTGRTFSPEKFTGRLRAIVMKDKKKRFDR